MALSDILRCFRKFDNVRLRPSGQLKMMNVISGAPDRKDFLLFIEKWKEYLSSENRWKP